MRLAGSLLVAALLISTTAAQAQPAAPAGAAAPAAPGAPAAAPAPVPPPGYAYPPPYGYPAPYAYPPGYPAPYPAYPAYPGYPPAYGVYQPARPAPAPTPPAPLPTGRWRLGAALMLIPQGHFSYELRYRGETQLLYARDIQTTGGVSVSAEYDVIRYVYVGLAFQYLPSIEWTNAAGIVRNPINGKASAYDFLPLIGARYSPTPRLRLLAYAAPGFSIFDASGVKQYMSSSGTAYGFALQLGGGLLYAIGQHMFFSLRGSYQWTAASKPEVQSLTTSETAELHARFRFVGAQGSLGYWF